MLSANPVLTLQWTLDMHCFWNRCATPWKQRWMVLSVMEGKTNIASWKDIWVFHYLSVDLTELLLCMPSLGHEKLTFAPGKEKVEDLDDKHIYKQVQHEWKEKNEWRRIWVVYSYWYYLFSAFSVFIDVKTIYLQRVKAVIYFHNEISLQGTQRNTESNSPSSTILKNGFKPQRPTWQIMKTDHKLSCRCCLQYVGLGDFVVVDVWIINRWAIHFHLWLFFFLLEN